MSEAYITCRRLMDVRPACGTRAQNCVARDRPKPGANEERKKAVPRPSNATPTRPPRVRLPTAIFAHDVSRPLVFLIGAPCGQGTPSEKHTTEDAQNKIDSQSIRVKREHNRDGRLTTCSNHPRCWKTFCVACPSNTRKVTLELSDQNANTSFRQQTEHTQQHSLPARSHHTAPDSLQGGTNLIDSERSARQYLMCMFFQSRHCDPVFSQPPP